MRSPPHLPAATTLTNQVWAKPQSSAGQLASDLVWAGSLLSQPEAQRDQGVTRPVLGGNGNSNPLPLVVTLWLSTPWFEARLKTLGDFSNTEENRFPVSLQSHVREAKGERLQKMLAQPSAHMTCRPVEAPRSSVQG